IRNHVKNIAFCGNYLSSRMAEQFSLLAAKYSIYYRHNKQNVVVANLKCGKFELSIDKDYVG
ncbi:MAG: hypothetical protein ACLTSN_05380, partial [Clostridium sp.]